jgi:hypothetical protein
MDNTTASLGTLGLLGSIYAEFTVHVDPETPNGVILADFDYELTSGEFVEEKSFVRKIGLLVEDWETNTFDSFEWQHGGDEPWELTMLYPHEGYYHARSGEIDDSQSSELSLSMEIMTADTIYFWRKTSSQSGDKLKFYINNNLMGEWSGTNSYAQEKYRVETGNHTFKWVYQKNGSGFSGSDAAWIDFIIMPPRMTLTCYAGPDDMICTGEDYQCQGEATDWVSVEWSTSGTGTFSNLNVLDPVYTPSADDLQEGDVELTLLATDDEGATADDEMTLTFNTIPVTPEMPEGPDYVDLRVTQESEYTTAGIANATAYLWLIEPPEAGTISGTGTAGIVQWSSSFMGTAQVSVKAMNECGESDFSDNYAVTVDNTVGVAELPAEMNVSIYPNPSRGEFMLDLSSAAPQNFDVSVYNMIGKAIYSKSGVQFKGKYQETIDLGSLPEGMYFFVIEGKDLYIAKKIIIRK